jgi:sugar phosphate isomerase/epimerase
MRLGGYYLAESINDLEPLCEKLDAHGLSAIQAPPALAEMSDEACFAYGEEARRLGLVIGEAGMWENLLSDEPTVRNSRIELVRSMLQKADLMDCKCVVSLVGTKDPTSDNASAPHADNYSAACRREFREVVLRILDGLDLQNSMYVIEPWPSSFFYRPVDIRGFIDSVDHPRFGLHLDQMNMVTHETFYRTGELINETFDLLADRVASVHLKDVQWDNEYMFVKWDEVHIGDGVMDYDTYLKRLSQLPADMTCYCEHFPAEADYVLCFSRLHALSEKAGTRFLGRQKKS